MRNPHFAVLAAIVGVLLLLAASREADKTEACQGAGYKNGVYVSRSTAPSGHYCLAADGTLVPFAKATAAR